MFFILALAKTAFHGPEVYVYRVSRVEHLEHFICWAGFRLSWRLGEHPHLYSYMYSCCRFEDAHPSPEKYQLCQEGRSSAES